MGPTIWLIAVFFVVAATSVGDLRMMPGSTEPSVAKQTNARQPGLRHNLCPGEAIVLPYTIFLPPAPLQADILLAFDTTGSMNDVIETTQARALEIMAGLQALIPDIRFGLIDFRDYAYFPYGRDDDWPYRLRQPLTARQQTVQARIADLEADGGANEPESYSRALYEAYADNSIGWRDAARRFVVMFGDSYPHDDDLNAGIPPPQPYLPNQAWQSGSYPSPHQDPGRDAAESTSDDLDFQTVLSDLHDQAITLLFVMSATEPRLVDGPSNDAILIYWGIWAGMTGPGGDAQVLDDLDALPETIMSLVTTAIRRIDRLNIRVAPSWFEDWVVTDPPFYDNIEIPDEGIEQHFEMTVMAPLDVPVGEYTFDLIAEADGIVYGRQQVEIVVDPACFFTPTSVPTPSPTWLPLPTPRPREAHFLPYIANNRVNLSH